MNGGDGDGGGGDGEGSNGVDGSLYWMKLWLRGTLGGCWKSYGE